MPTPGFDDPRLAAHPPGGNIYFARDLGVGAGAPAFETQADQAGLPGQSEAHGPGRQVSLMFGGGTTATGEAIVPAAKASRGHFTDVLNFHGSPAPWILIGILLVAGVLHIEAGGKAGVKL